MSLLAAQRHALILEAIDRDRALSIRAISDRLGVSRETIRKDIATLAAENRLNQVRGGAVRIEVAEPSLAERNRNNPAGKAAIARIAARLIPPGASVLLDSGSTTRALAALLAERDDLCFATNDLVIALALQRRGRDVDILGGRLSLDEESTSGPDALQMLAGYNFDLAFAGVGGLDAERLFSDFSREAAGLRGAMLRAATAPVLLADCSKFGRIAPARLDVAIPGLRLITDRAPPAAIRAALAAAGVALSIARA
ncbi:MAG: DeoR/GlpR transcriptional regulator [Hyphomicrobiales bacterium]|nr:DeoR/GlpR transcriptional regulator [Hyphomicrobiales bacterium]